MNETRTLLTETCNRLFSDLVTADTLRAAEAGEWPADLWAALEENGLTRPLVLEDQGGVGLNWQDTFAILYAAGYHAAPVPLAETIVASWLLAQAGIVVPEGVISLVPDERALKLTDGDSTRRVSGEVDNVPWGATAKHLLAVAVGGNINNKHFFLMDRDSVSVEPNVNIGRDPRETIRVFAATPVAVSKVPDAILYDPIRVFAALARSVQMAGAIAAVLDLCVQYAGDRVQFGRPLAKFQAIQHQLAILATEAAAAQTAAQFACRAVDVRNVQSLAVHEIAPAKIRTGEAAGKAAAIGHQVHGAIGFTDEHRLHYLTRRLWAWRSEFGAETYWAELLGSIVTVRGADELWQLITSMPDDDLGRPHENH
ncbi:MAG: acyl-CoA/acyl-ACP dehydrogenase [Alphaproteobacteria bacterium]|nr:acyl-CoA/acyl-ACP dehydrogenase [Alphaproteobacteria bacterium]